MANSNLKDNNTVFLLFGWCPVKTQPGLHSSSVSASNRTATIWHIVSTSKYKLLFRMVKLAMSWQILD